MSRSRKHVTTQLTTEYPEPTENQNIVRVVGTRGTNQVEVEFPNLEKVLVMMPTRFQKLVWTKKNDYLIITTDRTEVNRGKFKGIIEHILLPQHIKHLKDEGKWPEQFDDEKKQESENIPGEDGNPQSTPEEEEDGSSSDEDSSFEEETNPNRIVFSDSDDYDDDDD
ncbi:RNA-binding protein EIF1AD [Acrasis kona]|uniref:RNA-binding protein EIF1AD n=1 Tax=Acrasis kona TaxID=1008807 RepID=A0AAW2YXQ0_9EUKA